MTEPNKGFDLVESIALLFTSPKTRTLAIIISAILGGSMMYMWGAQ